MFIDVHCHIDLIKKNTQEIVERARKNKVGIIINSGLTPKTNRLTLELSEKFQEIKAALGVYPTEALKLSEKELEEEITFIKKYKEKIFAIGEVGLDLKEVSSLEKQSEIFKKFISLSIEINKPLIVHSRKAEKEAIELLENLKTKKVIMHCFSGKIPLIKRVISNNWFLSVPTSVKNSEHFQNLIKIVPIEYLFCETDSPFLHPDKLPNNEPSNVIESYKKIAEIKKLTLKETEKAIENNFKKLFFQNQ